MTSVRVVVVGRMSRRCRDIIIVAGRWGWAEVCVVVMVGRRVGGRYVTVGDHLVGVVVGGVSVVISAVG